MSRYCAVLFDIDGTLLDTFNMNMYPLLRIIKEEFNQDWAVEDVAKYMAMPGMKTMEDLGVPDRETTYQRWVRYVNEYEEGAIPFEGIRAVLETLRQHGIRQAVVSSKKRKQYQIDMVQQGLDVYMETAVLEEDTPYHKPHPAPLEECLRRMGLTPNQAIYIGDTPTDALAAQAACLDFAHARWGNHGISLTTTATHVLSHPQDLLQILGIELEKM